MSRKIAVILNEEQIRYLWGHAIEMEDKAKDAGRSHSERFFIEMQEALFNAEEDAKLERETELNYERGAA
jgi:hypothetical protein